MLLPETGHITFTIPGAENLRQTPNFCPFGSTIRLVNVKTPLAALIGSCSFYYRNKSFSDKYPCGGCRMLCSYNKRYTYFSSIHFFLSFPLGYHHTRDLKPGGNTPAQNACSEVLLLLLKMCRGTIICPKTVKVHPHLLS